jgi:hypothetical protein
VDTPMQAPCSSEGVRRGDVRCFSFCMCHLPCDVSQIQLRPTATDYQMVVWHRSLVTLGTPLQLGALFPSLVLTCLGRGCAAPGACFSQNVNGCSHELQLGDSTLAVSVLMTSHSRSCSTCRAYTSLHSCSSRRKMNQAPCSWEVWYGTLVHRNCG